MFDKVETIIMILNVVSVTLNVVIMTSSNGSVTFYVSVMAFDILISWVLNLTIYRLMSASWRLELS